MLIYFILTALANILFSYYLLNITETKGAKDFVSSYGKFRFYLVSALIGWFIVPLFLIVIFSELNEK